MLREGDKPGKKFKGYPVGYFHIDIAELRTEQGKRLFVGIDGRFVVLVWTQRDDAHRIISMR